MQKSVSSIGDILDRLSEAVRAESDAGSGKVRVGSVLDTFGARTYGPFLLVPALLELSPLGGIPGVPTLIALMILRTAAQMLAGREHIWIPAFIQRKCVKGDMIESFDEKARPLARWLDNHTRERLSVLTRTPAIKAAAALIICLCLTVPPLELIPFASSIPMGTIAMFGLALTVRDGLVMLIAFLSVIAAIGGIVWVAL